MYLGLVFVILEVGVRMSSLVFENITDRVKLKSAMVLSRDQTDVVFIGSSRFKDGVAPSIVSSGIEGNPKVFNGATTGTNLKRMKYFFDRIIEKEGVKVVIIEMSMPNIQEGALGFDEVVDTFSVESFLYNQVAVSKIVEWRKSFRLQNLKNSVAILGANKFEGSEWFRRGGFSTFFSDEKSNWELKGIAWEIPIRAYEFEGIAELREEVEVFKQISLSAKEKGVEVLLVVPPLVNNRLLTERTDDILAKYSLLAKECGVDLVDYSALSLGESLFRDQDSHLNEEGRAYFSQALANMLNEKVNWSNVIQ